MEQDKRIFKHFGNTAQLQLSTETAELDGCLIHSDIKDIGVVDLSRPTRVSVVVSSEGTRSIKCDCGNLILLDKSQVAVQNCGIKKFKILCGDCCKIHIVTLYCLRRECKYEPCALQRTKQKFKGF